MKDPVHWADDFIREERAWLELARERGVSSDALTMSERLLDRLAAARTAAESTTFTVSEAASITGLHVETIRRFARKRVGDRRRGEHIQLNLAQLRELGVNEKAKPKTRSLVDHFARRPPE